MDREERERYWERNTVRKLVARPAGSGTARSVGRFGMPVDFGAAPKAVAVALGSFAALGTVTALWENPVFFRMTPAGGFEIVLLAALSLLLGLYFAMPRQACAGRQAGVGSVLTFLGIACPVCNQILLLVFGSELLLVYFEPIRVYVAAAGVLVTGVAVWMKWATVALPAAREESR